DIDDDNDGILDTTENGVCVSDPFVNGSFENTLPLLPATSYIITPDPNVPGWQSTEGKIEIWSTGFNGVPAAIGNQFAELNANVPGTLYQTFCLNGASGTVKWSIKHRGRSGVDQAFVKFGKTLADAQASTPIVTMVDGNTAWGTYSGVYTIPFGQTQIVLTFQSGYTASGSPSIGNFIDDVQITITQNSLDSDQDGIVNILDLDDENDGIPDIEEAGFKMYSNNSSTMDKSNPASWKDVNGNGMNDYIDTIIANGTYSIPNTDGDSVLDYLDLDSDNDTLFDVDEAGLLNGDGDINGDGKGDGIDTDSDGILDLYDNASFFGTNYRAYTNDSDANGTPNYKQLDSNSDGINDIKTSLYGSFDANNDGKIDGSGDIDKDGITDTFDTNTSTWGSPRNLNRKMYLDFDGRNDYAQGNSVLNGLTEASIMAFIDLNSTFSDTGVVLGQTNFQIRVNNSKKLQVIVNGTTLTYNAEALHVSQWTHVGAIYGNGELKLYINGKIVNSTSLSGAIIDDGSLLTIGKNPTSNSNYFKGKIDEVRVFNIALSDEQLQRMVYQEIQDNSGEVRGAVIPRNIGALPFSNLLRYYRMDVYKDDIIDDLTTTTIDTGTGMKIFNHKVIDYQEAPLPFTTSKTGDFETAVDNPSRDIRGLDVIEYDYSIIEVNHNINETSNASDIGLVIAPGVTVTMNNDTKLLNDWYLKLDGKIDLQGKSQLIQTIFSELDATSIGSIERDQQGQSNKYNYNYWSSPVGVINNTSNNNSYTVASVMKDGTNPNDVKDITWVSGHDGAPTSPISTSSFWIYKFQNTTPIYANWSQVKQNGTLLAGQGYTMKGCGSASGTQNYTFVGKPNNGNITLPIAANNLNLCGNPYPSAIDSEEFLLDNLSSTTGAVYFWEHYTTNNTHVTRDYQGGYATRNLVGGTPPVSPVEISGLGSSTRVPSRFIPVGQGFLVYGSATGGDINFGNNQRAFIKESNANSNVMFKQKPLKNAAPTSNNSEDEITNNNFKKLRLGFNSANNYHRQILIGFMNELATSGIDAGFDAPNIDKQPNDMYFINNKVNLIIQGDGYFDTKNSYPLGLKTNAEGKISFTLDGLENFENDQDVFIYDNETNQYHNISKDIFEINLPKGTFDNRFSLRFIDSNTSLSNNDFNLSDSVFIAFTSNNKSINVKNSLIDTTVNSVVLFNMLGQIVSSWDVKTENQSNIQIPVKNVSTGTYIIKVTTTSGDISKKVIVQ
ncbi:MAG TPA: LamG-like jellyroll fold domain-containing protein, partial [Flavobacterium sp.]|nr:LamG-like jellyroll fold domain-containing protein [Flavobacterium sp.]